MHDGTTYPKNAMEFAITTEELLADIQQANDTADTVSEATGKHRSNLKSILEERGYHKKAFADFRAMQSMSDSKFADYWRTFEACVKAYGPVADRRIRDMVDGMDKEASDMEADLGP